MFFFFPWNTDAPIYHWPIATASLIAINALVFFGQLSGHDADAITTWALWHGNGIHPLQWITSNFIHSDIWHLLGNMTFLWVFGLIVEGKVGFFRFVALFFGIGVVECAIEQVLALRVEENISFGASSIVYGLMSIALVWAPKNDVQFVGVFAFGFRGGSAEFDVPVMWLAVFYVGLDLLIAAFTGFSLQTAVLHLFGATLGFLAGMVMLRRELVDCEGWDIISVWHGREGRTSLDEKDALHEDPELLARRQVTEAETSQQKIAQLIAQKQGRLAALFYQQKVRTLPGWQLPESELVALIRAVDTAEAYDVAIPILVEYLERFPAKALHARLKLAQVLINSGTRPRQAARVLSKLPAGPLPPKLETLRQELLAQAQAQEADGVMELAVEDW